MDEPTLGFDIIVKSKIYEFLKRINKEEKTTIIFSSHIISDVEKLCKEVIILNKGRLVWNGKITVLPKIFGNVKEISFTFKKIKNLEKFKVFMKNYKPSIWDDKVSLLINEEKEKEVLTHISEIFETNSFEMKNPDLEALLSKIYKSKMKISKQS
jgi:ABC-2 type transport system ATP-binding protein